MECGNSAALDMASVFYFWSNLTLVNVKHGRRSQIEWASHFPSIFSSGFYIWVLEWAPDPDWEMVSEPDVKQKRNGWKYINYFETSHISGAIHSNQGHIVDPSFFLYTQLSWSLTKKKCLTKDCNFNIANMERNIRKKHLLKIRLEEHLKVKSKVEREKLQTKFNVEIVQRWDPNINRKHCLIKSKKSVNIDVMDGCKCGFLYSVQKELQCIKNYRY